MTVSALFRGGFAAVVVTLALGASPPVRGEDRPPGGQDGKPPAETPQKKPDFRDFSARLKELPVEDVIAAIELRIVEEPDNVSHGIQRELIVHRLEEAGQYAAAAAQAEKLYEYLHEHLDQEQAVLRLDTATMILGKLYRRTDQGTKETECWDRSIARLRERLKSDPTGPASRPLVSLVGVRAANISQAGNRSAARRMIQEEGEALLAIRREHPQAIAPAVAWIKLMERRGLLAESNGEEDWEALFRERDQFLQAAIREDSGASELLSCFVHGRAQHVMRLVKTKPRDAKMLLDEGIVIANRTIAASVAEKKPISYSAQGVLAPLRAIEPTIKQSLELKSLIGEPAPRWEVEAWVHGEPLPRESLRGRPVILYFWTLERSYFAPPLPQLNSWHDEFHALGLEVIGVTGQWNFSWDAQKRRPVLAEEDLPLEVERQAMEQYLTQYQVRFPTLITPKGTGMRKAYGVSEMPQIVLIDRQGIVRASTSGPFNEGGLSRFREEMKKAVEAPAPGAP